MDDQQTSTNSGKRKFALVSFSAIFIFLALMVYALKRDAQFVPSQLINKSAPVFASQTAQGSTFDLKQYAGQGRWVIVNFWSTTCVVCRYEAPELERFYEMTTKQGSAGPIFVSVNIQEEAPLIMSYQRDHRLSYPVVMDLVGKISLDYGVTGTPETFFIDPKGVVRHRVAGEVDNDSIFRFIDWLEKNPNLAPDEALRDFAQIRNENAG